jgi:aspartyl-tRNA(Asn)/glutamyl-tRNA(Gln) amidotransferase subunit A
MNLGQVKRRILMGTYALSAGYYDAFYKRSQQVRTLIQRDFKAALQDVDVLLSPVAPSAAYKIGEKLDNPLSMYLGDLMTVCILINTCYSLESLFKGLGFKHRCTHT